MDATPPIIPEDWLKPGAAVSLLTALVVFLWKRMESRDGKHETQVATLQASHQAALEKLQASHQAALERERDATREAEARLRTVLEEAREDAETYVESLGIERGKASELQRLLALEQSETTRLRAELARHSEAQQTWTRQRPRS